MYRAWSRQRTKAVIERSRSDATGARRLRDDIVKHPETTAAYEQTLSEFTVMTQELNEQLILLAKVVPVQT